MLAILRPTPRKYTVLAAMYSALFVIAPIMSNRVVSIFGVKALLGSILLIVALGLLDVVNNDFGIQKAKDVIWAGLLVRLTIWFSMNLLLLIPSVHDTAGFEEIVRSSFALLMAGEVSIFVSQYFVDIRIFDFMKSKSKSFFIRYSLSNLASYTLGLLIFLPLAFWGKPVDLIELFTGQVIVRLSLQLILAPVFAFISASTSTNTEYRYG